MKNCFQIKNFFLKIFFKRRAKKLFVKKESLKKIKAIFFKKKCMIFHFVVLSKNQLSVHDLKKKPNK